MNDWAGSNEEPKQHAQPSTSVPVPAGGDIIIDNRSRRVLDFLRESIAVGSDLSIVSAYFTIYAYGAMRQILENAGRIRFLYGEPTATSSLDPSENESKSFLLNKDGGIVLQDALAQKPLARACAAWIQRHVDIRTIDRANFLHGKLYHIENHAESAALAGSSNFTLRGLGLGSTPNVELNLEIRNEEEKVALLGWFNDLWADESLTRDAKADVLAALERLGRPYTPEFVYYKTLYHVFETRLEQHIDRDYLLQEAHLYDTEVWKSLYEFQRDGAKSAINRLLHHNGCIVADSVGLGKTWTALAIIKFFESRNEKVLVLCPKRLEDNWIRYTSWAAYQNNPFERDRLGYSVRTHTDLSRYKGLARGVDLRNFNWGSFDLIVIDESHNFRNEGQDRKNEEGDIVRRSRYNRLLEEAIKGGVSTKVLMLSATPVNTSLRDLRNQIYLMTEKREAAFRETLGIGNIKSMFGVAQREFQQWETVRRSNGNADKAQLLERLGADFLTLLDAVTIARSRDHINRFYPDVTERIGGFPQREKPENLYPPTDREGLLSYDDLHDQIGQFRLAIYMPSQYLKDTTGLEQERAKLHFDQRDREHWLIGMMRVNLLKRLESAVHSFTLTMDRIIKKMDYLESQISEWHRGRDGSFDFQPDEDMEDDDFTVGRGRRYQFEQLDLERLQKDLLEDRRILQALYEQAAQVTVDRDAKLAELKQVLRRKITEPPQDKDGRANRKVLVFTTFADTAGYVYENLKDWAHYDLDVHIALVSGSGRNESSTGHSGFIDILERFAPNAQQATGVDEEIDILIATDCLSEGQNLQDCDLIVNYDIHWNPVRLMQRFGRIDRLGSRNKRVAMTNFWPTRDLDRYLDLKNRVEARMALADVAGTGLDDPLSDAPNAIEKTAEGTHLELTFRDRQLQQMRDEILDIEDTDEGLSFNDLTLDDFIADILQYIQLNRAALEKAPLGINAVVDTHVRDGLSDVIRPGVIFCLKRRGDPSARTPNRLWPYFLVYVHDDGTVRYTFKQARHCLAIFQALSAGNPQASTTLEDAFNIETEHGQKMGRYNKLLDSALENIVGTFSSAELANLGHQRGAKVTEKLNSVDEFDLITWMIIKDKQCMADRP